MATESTSPPQNTVALGAGFGIGILWWVMAVTCFWSSYRGYDHGRYDWGPVGEVLTAEQGDLGLDFLAGPFGVVLEDAPSRRFEEALRKANDEPITKPTRDFDLD